MHLMSRRPLPLLLGLCLLSLAACRAAASELPAITGRSAETGAARQTSAARAGSSTSFDPGAVHLTLQQITTSVREPTGVFSAYDGSGRLFVTERATGRILILRDGQVLPRPFLDIGSLILGRGQEQGLLGLAFHPQYTQNGLFYVNYTASNG